MQTLTISTSGHIKNNTPTLLGVEISFVKSKEFRLRIKDNEKNNITDSNVLMFYGHCCCQ